MLFLKFLFLMITGFPYFTICRSQTVQANIIFFLVDDMGWNDVGFHGLKQIPTPNIDTLAANGVVLNNYYTAPACSPSRSALMSGRYPTTTGLQHLVILDAQQVGLGLEYNTLPQELKSIGYDTHMVGKWHLGFFHPDYTPTRRGFNSHYGFWTGDSDFFYHNTDYNYTISLGGQLQMLNVPDTEPRQSLVFSGLNFRSGFNKVTNKAKEYLTDIYTDYSVELIKKHKKTKPLFLYLSHHGVHRGNFFKPVTAPTEYTNVFTNIPDSDRTRKNFAGALTAIDISLGKVMKALQENEMLNNTIFVFSSDNGAPMPGSQSSNGGSNYPLRGGKLTGWEGGVKGNAFIWSPYLKTQGIYDGLMHIADWMPTLYTAAGQNASALGQLDGYNIWNAINSNSPSPRREVLLQSDSCNNLTSYRRGFYKLVSGKILGDDDLNGYYGESGRGKPPPGFDPQSSTTAEVLRKFYNKADINYFTKPIYIKCGNCSKSNVKGYCSPDKPCVFNLKDDPCECNDIASKYPLLLQKLQSYLSQQYVRVPLYPMPDFNSLPLYFSGYWNEWKSDHLMNSDALGC